MDLVLVSAALAGGVIATLVVLRVVTRDFARWKLSDKLGLVQSALPFAAAVFALNAFAGDKLERPSKIVAAVLTLLAGLLAILKHVAATMEARHATPGQVEEAGEPAPAVSLSRVLATLFKG